MKTTTIVSATSMVSVFQGLKPFSDVINVGRGSEFFRSVTSLLQRAVGALMILAGSGASAATWSASFINPLTGRSGGSIQFAAEGRFLDPTYNNGVALTDRREHVGEDYPIGNGSRIYAITGGTVLGVYGSGKDTALAVDHGSFVGVYGHISPSVTRVGARIDFGQPIGTVVDYGSSGTSGDHLHFGILEKVGAFAKTVLNIGWGRRPYGTPRSQILSEGWRDPIPFLNGQGGASGGSPATSDPEGNTRSSAKQLTLNATTPATMSANDVDYFVFNVPGSGELEIKSIGNLDLIGKLEDLSGRFVVEDDDSGSGYNFQIRRAVTAGKYYLRVTGYRDRQVGGYGLEAGFRASPAGSSGSSGSGSSASQGGEIVLMNGSRAVPSGSLLILSSITLNRISRLDLRLRNVGSGTASITGVSLSSRDLRPRSSAPTSIRPGSTTTIPLYLAPSQRGQQTWGVRVSLSNGEPFTVWFRADVR